MKRQLPRGWLGGVRVGRLSPTRVPGSLVVACFRNLSSPSATMKSLTTLLLNLRRLA